MYFGENGYLESTKKIISTARYIKDGWAHFTYLLNLQSSDVTMDLQYLYIELPVPYKLSQELEAKLKQQIEILDMYLPYWVSWTLKWHMLWG